MVKLITIIKINWVLSTLIILVAITLLSLSPLEELPAVPGSDKTHHLIAYALLMLPVALRKPDYWILYGLFFIAYGGVIELLQLYVNRHGEWMDMLANVAGVVCGLIIAEIVHFFISTKDKASS